MSDPNAVETTKLQDLYSDHHRWLRGWLQKNLGCSEATADLAQDTFVRLIRKSDLVHTLREPRAYLSTVARGLMFDHWRRRAFERSYLELLESQPEPVQIPLEDQQLIIESLNKLAAIVEGLKPRDRRDREIFLLAPIDGLQYKQIAAQLDISVRIVQKAMTRAMHNCYQVMYGE